MLEVPVWYWGKKQWQMKFLMLWDWPILQGLWLTELQHTSSFSDDEKCDENLTEIQHCVSFEYNSSEFSS